MSLTNSLENMGLTEKQAKVYLACLELGGGNVTNIAKKAGIQRTTCYPVLNELLNLGLVSKAKQKKRGYFLVEDPKILEQNTKLKLQTIEETLPELNAIYNVLPQKPKILFYEGEEGAKNIFNDILNTLKEGDTILACTGFKTFLHYLPKNQKEHFIKQRLAKKIRIRFITPFNDFFQEYQNRSTQELREVKMVSDKNWSFTADMHIYKNKVSIISPKENFIGIIIDSKEIAEMMKMAFELMWKGAGTASP